MNIEIPESIVQRAYYLPTEAPVNRSAASTEQPSVSTGLTLFLVITLAMIAINVASPNAFYPCSKEMMGIMILSLLSQGLFYVVTHREAQQNVVSTKAEVKTETQENIVGVRFHQDHVAITMITNTGHIIRKIDISEIKPVSAYVQDGWFSTRDKGLLIESSDDNQMRVALYLTDEKLRLYANDLILSLRDLSYPTQSTISCQS